MSIVLISDHSLEELLIFLANDKVNNEDSSTIIFLSVMSVYNSTYQTNVLVFLYLRVLDYS